jgi:hypothetical protein
MKKHLTTTLVGGALLVLPGLAQTQNSGGTKTIDKPAACCVQQAACSIPQAACFVS